MTQKRSDQGGNLINTLKTLARKNIAPIVIGGIIGGLVGFQFGKDIGFDIGSLAGWEMHPTSGHKTDSGNQGINYKQIVDLPDSEQTKKENGDNYSECNEVQNDSTQVEFEFYIQLDCASVPTDGALTASFLLFNENNLLTPASMDISLEVPVVSVSGQTINILPAYYQPIVGDPTNCAVNFMVTANFYVDPLEVENAYSIVFEILDDASSNHLDFPDFSKVPVDCQNVPANTLQYYQCIKAGNTHHKDHITIENIFLCEGD